MEPFRPSRPWKAIAAMARNRVIGDGNAIPWHIPEDFKWFKQATMGGLIAMGRNTWESIGRPLPGRTNVILSRSLQTAPTGAHVVAGLAELDAFAEENLAAGADVWICGGSTVYAQALPLCIELYLSRVFREVQGDAFFPRFEHQYEKTENLLEHEAFTVERWIRRKGGEG